jgi:hypothetical protein
LLEEAATKKQEKLQEKLDQEEERKIKLAAEAENWKDIQSVRNSCLLTMSSLLGGQLAY